MGRENSELDRLPAGELKRRAEEHLKGALGELESAKVAAREKFAPTRLIRAHPFAAAAAAGALGLVLARVLLRRRRAKERPASEAAKPESSARAFRRSLVLGLARGAGLAASGAILKGWRAAAHLGRHRDKS